VPSRNIRRYQGQQDTDDCEHHPGAQSEGDQDSRPQKTLKVIPRERAHQLTRGPAVVKDWVSFVDAARPFGGWLLSLFPRIWRMLLQTVMGGICAVILILLAQSTEGLSPPISIKIQDFWGGVVVGLFSIPLSRWIWTQVQPAQPPPQP
jgi:hypothetical protein